MKFYECDICGKRFKEKEGMTESVYSENYKTIKMAVTEPESERFQHLVKQYNVRKTLEITEMIPTSDPLIFDKRNINVDLCIECVKKVEKK